MSGIAYNKSVNARCTMGKITTNSSADELIDFITFHKYLSFDVEYGKEIEDFLVGTERIVDSLSEKNEKIPSDLIIKLIYLVGDEYDG
jgi:hypothetical protein